MAKALLLDLDGTLVDSLPDLAAALNRLLLEQELAPLRREEVLTMVGDGAAKLVERALKARELPFGPAFLDQALERFLAFYEAAPVVETSVYPGAIAALRTLKAAGWRLAVCTNKPEALARRILKALELWPLLDGLAGGDSLAVRKPDPGHPLGLLARLGVPPPAAVLLGDGAQDLQAARAAGLDEIWARFGYGGAAAEALRPAVTLHRFALLPELLGARPAPQ